MNEVLKGLALAVAWWFIAVFVAFKVFTIAEEHTVPILVSTLAISFFGARYLLGKHVITKDTLIWYLVWFVILVGFYYLPINENIPPSAINLNNQISVTNPDRYDYAEELFFTIEGRWNSPVRQYLLEPGKTFFIKDYETFWFLTGYVPSNIQAQMYYHLLIKSGRFNADEVEVQNDFCANSPHGLVYFKERDIYADFWAVDNFPSPENKEVYKFGDRAVYPCNKLLLFLNLII